MAKKNSFLLVSLKESEAKTLAQVISNDTSRKILDYLGEKEHATESQIAKELDLPISTIHYNLQQLMKSKLIESEEFHYSEKGKEVNHYKLANKYIIIAPKSTWGFKEKLKSILPVGILAAGAAVALQFFNRVGSWGNLEAAPVAQKAAVYSDAMPAVMEAEKAVAEELAADAAPQAVNTGADMARTTFESGDAASGVVQEAANRSAEAVASCPDPSGFVSNCAQMGPTWQNIALWFIIGVSFALIVYLIVDWIRHRKD